TTIRVGTTSCATPTSSKIDDAFPPSSHPMTSPRTTSPPTRFDAPSTPPEAMSEVEHRTMRKVSLRLLPLLFLLYIASYLDRTNLGMAALQMNKQIGLSSAAYGFGASIFFIGYALFEVPSNIILARVGARRWIARIAITWGILSCAMLFTRG